MFCWTQMFFVLGKYFPINMRSGHILFNLSRLLYSVVCILNDMEVVNDYCCLRELPECRLNEPFFHITTHLFDIGLYLWWDTPEKSDQEWNTIRWEKCDGFSGGKIRHGQHISIPSGVVLVNTQRKRMTSFFF